LLLRLLQDCGGSVCGNDFTEPPEECDWSDDAACPGLCRPDCTCAESVCGNDYTELGEECDWSDDAACPGQCLPDCTCPSVCGNNFVESGEECDGNDGFACPGTCQPDCTCPIPSCGNNIVDPGEYCDDAFSQDCVTSGIRCGLDCQASDVSSVVETCDGTDENCNGQIDEGINCNQLPIAHYNFNGNANDISQNSNHGAVSGATLTTGVEGQAYSFDGSNDYITIPEDNDLDFDASEEFTITAWINMPDTGNDHAIYVKRQGKDQGYYLVARWTQANKGKVQFGVEDSNNANSYRRTTSNSLTPDAWAHIAAVHNTDNDMKIYINGVEANYQVSSSAASTSYDTIKPAYIGMDKENNRHPFEGMIDDLRVYDYALSSSEIQNAMVP